MRSRRLFGIVALLSIFTGSAVVMSMAQPPDELREQSSRLFRDGNFQEAYTGFRQLCVDPETDPNKVPSDLVQAVQCLLQLGRTQDLDALLEESIKAHSENWRLLKTAAQQYQQIPHHGFVIAGQFERGDHRGGGQAANVFERDRTRSLQLLVQARDLAADDPERGEVGSLYLELADALLGSRHGGDAWRLQYLTDLTTLPEHEEGYPIIFRRGEPRGAPVDAEGNPVYHRPPESWDAAKTDGERWRWALAEAAKVHPQLKNECRFRFAGFLESQFGVATLQQIGPWFRAETSEPEDSGTYALHTLEETETIARLASGIKRFTLPDEFNPIRVYQQIADDPETGHGENALHALAQIFANRRQYPSALEYWESSVTRYGRTDHKQQQIDQIRGNWGQFEPHSVAPAGQGASFEFRFRNGTQVTFAAREVKLEQLLTDVKNYLKSNPSELQWQQLNIADLGWRLVQDNQDKYLGRSLAEWTLDLEPRPDHFDRRITVTTPLQKAGVYFVTAKMKDGNTCHSLVWVADTAIVHTPLKGKHLYYVGDAQSGAPVAGANVEFFGYQQRRPDNRRRAQVFTQSFAERTDANGFASPDAKFLDPEYQWLVIARTGDGRLAYLGFQGMWLPEFYDPHYEATKAYAVTDRPVYRPDQKVHFKIWFAHTRYDEDGPSPFANQSIPVEIYNPRGEKVYESELTADKYGGVEGEYSLPNAAPLGVYYFQTPRADTGVSTTFRVEEYKKPEFEVTVEAPDKPVMLGERITATIKANYYFGAPVTTASVKYKVLRTTYDNVWYPVMPWDWCYGPGYWWFAYDYPWYPGWEKWVGSTRPLGHWWPHPSPPPEVVAENEVEIREDGTVTVEIDTAVAKELHGNHDHRYSIEVEVRDQSRRTITGQGEVLVARKPFKVYTWIERGYYRAGDTIAAHFLAQTLDHRAVQGSGEAKLLKITYDEQRKPIETAVATWPLDTNEQGRADLKIDAADSGQYRLSYRVTDAEEHVVEGGYIFTVIGESFAASDYRFNALELVPDQREYQPGDKVQLQINTDRPNSTVLLFLRPSNGVYLPPQVLRLEGKSTIATIDVSKRDMPSFFVEAMTIANGEVHTELKEIVVPPEKRVLNVEVLPAQREYKPGEKAQVQIKVTDFDGNNFVGSLAATVYDKSVEYISGGSNVPDMKEYFWKWRRTHQPAHQSSLERFLHNLVRPNEAAMQPIGIFGETVADELDKSLGAKLGSLRGGGMGGMARGRMNALAEGAAAPPGALTAHFGMAQAAPADAMATEGRAAGGGDAVQPAVRVNFADTALWAGNLETNAEGIAEISLNMPENLTTWKVQVWGMGAGTRVGSGNAEMITRKNLILRMQTPRFAVQKDELLLTANVHNYLKNDKDVAVSIESEGDVLELIGAPDATVRVAADGEARVDFRVRVLREGLATVRMKAITDEESDAMQLTFPCLVHGILKTESWAGTIRPDGQTATIHLNVPEERRAEQTVLELRYSPTLAGAMVDALPYLIDFPYGCTEQTLNRFLPAAITQKVLIEMNLDLASIREKRTNLNAQEIGEDAERAKQWKRYDREPVFDPEQLSLIVKEGVMRLTNMQNQDGGWGWFSGWNETSTAHMTALVVRGLIVAKANDVALVPGTLERGVQWLQNYQAEQVQRIKNADGKIDPWKPHADELDAFVYHVLVEADTDNPEMGNFLYRDRNEISVYGKALMGLAYDRLQQSDKLAMMLRNLRQYVVEDTENETAYLKLPNENYWWFWYGDEIEAQAAYLKLLARHEPQGETAPRLVKYLLNNRKHATYWKSTRDTALCVEAFADYLRATGETRPDMVVEVWLDGEKQKEVSITAENLFSFDNRFVLSGEAVTAGEHTLELRRQGSGPVYFNAYLTNFTLEDPITKAGLEIKVQRRYYKLTRDDRQIKVAGDRGQPLDQRVEHYVRTPLAELETLTSGDLVEIELEIESKNDYEYLMFEDWKAAGLEPVEVQSGYTTNGLGAYMELRDDRVTFFVRQLARGRHSLSYRMRAEIPGQFSALPTQGSGMYAPELRGNSDETKVRVEDLETQ